MKTKALILAAGLQLAALSSLHAQGFTIDWFTIDGGGGVSSGGAFSVSGTIGQADAGLLASASFTLQGGFWGIAAPDELGPALAISRNPISGVVTISWPRPAAGFLLDRAASLPSAPAGWSQVALPYQTNATHIFITLPSPSARGFFRLRR